MSAILDVLLRRTSVALVALGILVVLLALGTTVPVVGNPFVVSRDATFAGVALGGICFLVGIFMVVHEHMGSQTSRDRRSSFGRSLASSAYPPGEAFNFYGDMRALAARANDIKLISMGLQILWVNNMLDVLVERARKGAKVTVCMANPNNPAVLQRLIEEEMFEVQPQVRRKGIENNIQTLLHRLSQEERLQSFRFCLFEHYPTLATFIADQDVFVAPYTYQRLGSDAPVLHLRNDGHDTVARFIVEDAERTLRDAVSAAEIDRAHRDRRYLSADWTAACVAVVPHAQEPLNQFGSSIVGFDLWAGAPPGGARRRLRQVTNAVGDAGDIGFHAPIVGPLYFANRAGVRRLLAHLRIVADEFHRFTLTRLRIEDRSDAGSGMVLACDDESGVVEALHSELVSHVNRSAISSGFLAKRAAIRAGVGPASLRTSLMIDRYRAPHVLSGFELFFPLCTHPPRDPAARAQLLQQLQDAYRHAAPGEHLDVDQIHLLVRSRDDAHWLVHHSYHLRPH